MILYIIYVSAEFKGKVGVFVCREGVWGEKNCGATHF